MALMAMTLREGSFSVASMAMGKSICSPALASILSGEESAISGGVAPCIGWVKPERCRRAIRRRAVLRLATTERRELLL